MAGSVSKDLELTERFEFDKAYRSHYGIICGIDEAGRGPLVGAVYTAAVVLPDDAFIEGLNDSKKLSEKKREALFDLITEKALAYCVSSATAEEINELNILRATMLAMKRAFDGLSVKPAFALIDGNRTPDLGISAEAVVKGDFKSASIAAASILAKVSRDRYMKELDERYPEYGFAQHKGYGTAQHIEALKKYGPCPEHRTLFIRKFV